MYKQPHRYKNDLHLVNKIIRKQLQNEKENSDFEDKNDMKRTLVSILVTIFFSLYLITKQVVLLMLH